MNDRENYRCTVSVTLEIIGGKWKSLILWQLSFKTLRFSQLQRRLAKITQRGLDVSRGLATVPGVARPEPEA